MTGSTRVGIETWHKQGLFRTMAKIQFGLHSMLALVTKIFSFVFYFAPTLGLFHLGTHAKKEQMAFANDFVVDVESSPVVGNDSQVGDRPHVTRMSALWQQDGTSTTTTYTLLNLPSFYVFFLVFLPWQCAGLFILKRGLVESFNKHESLASKVLHVISCITYPSIFKDWDECRVTSTRSLHVIQL